MLRDSLRGARLPSEFFRQGVYSPRLSLGCERGARLSLGCERGACLSLGRNLGACLSFRRERGASLSLRRERGVNAMRHLFPLQERKESVRLLRLLRLLHLPLRRERGAVAPLPLQEEKRQRNLKKALVRNLKNIAQITQCQPADLEKSVLRKKKNTAQII
jgi:hypothetical protein